MTNRKFRVVLSKGTDIDGCSDPNIESPSFLLGAYRREVESLSNAPLRTEKMRLSELEQKRQIYSLVLLQYLSVDPN